MSIIKTQSKLGNILKDVLNELKGDILGENFVYWIDSVPSFDTPDDGYKSLRNFLTNSKEFMKVEIDFYKKYSPLVFHENSYKNIEAGLRYFEIIEVSL
ncbi:MAG: hypothetical protein ACMG57_05650 [Candidatus Dojkabacteria bacterium]